MLGRIYYDANADRLDVLGDDGLTYGGLHCGQTVMVDTGSLIMPTWTPARVERSDDNGWFLTGYQDCSCLGMRVEVELG